MVRAVEQGRVKCDENEKGRHIGIRRAKDTVDDNKGKEYAILKKEDEIEFTAGSFIWEKHCDQG